MVERQPAESHLLSNEAGRSSQSVPALPTQEAHYEISVAGHLDEHWADWFGDLSIQHDPQGNTVLHGTIQDQAALHGLLVQIRDLGLILVSLRRID